MSGRRTGRHGFTLTEMAIVSVMTGILAIVLGTAWSGLAQPSIDIMVRCQMEQEAQLAAMSLATDCGGYLPVKTSNIQGGITGLGTAVFSGASINSDQLQLTFTDGTTITYKVDDDHRLIRETTNTATSSVVIASNVYGMTLEEDGNFIKVAFLFQFRATGSDKYRIPYTYILYVPTVIS
ncbi:MAG: prepilin-type N-terminal cleavage/methylation domain-containing protein [Pirellulales bacterium]|nr:prepilin-type N-terminal cleavage/methylation domain-containing protein [Pirellulales bacterium]